jgi:nucleotide-binding universal stress UspA family protein
MFKHLLIATDGSELARHAVTAGISLAKSLGGRLTAVLVTPPWESLAIGEVAIVVPRDDYEKRAASSAGEALGNVLAEAKTAGIQCDVVHRSSRRPWEELLKVAGERGCDLIVMASHGRGGLSSAFLGSETVKVLSHGKVPVLVVR